MSNVENYSETQERYLENEKKNLFDRIETAIQKLKTTDSDEFSKYLSDFNKCFEDLITFTDVYKLNESELNTLYEYLDEKNKIIEEKREYLIITAIEKGLKSESSAVLGYNLSDSRKKSLINSYCEKFSYDCRPNKNDIVAFYEAPTSISTLFAALVGNDSRKGILFLKDRFYYNCLYEIYYCDIKHVDCSSTNLKLYKDKSTYITLNGISYVEPTAIPKIFKQIYELNDDKIEITFKDKAKNFGVKVANAILSELENSANRLEQDVKQAERKAQRIVNNGENYSSEQLKKAESVLNSGASDNAKAVKDTYHGWEKQINSEKDTAWDSWLEREKKAEQERHEEFYS